MKIISDSLTQVCKNFSHAGWLAKPRILVTACSKDGEHCQHGYELVYSEWSEQVEEWVGRSVASLLPHWHSVTVQKIPGKRN